MLRLREGDKIIIDPHEIVLEKTDAVCIHALPPLLRYAIALTEGIDAAKLGLSKNLQDNLNIHTYGSFYERFEPEAARKLCKKFEFHYTPKKASWLNIWLRLSSQPYQNSVWTTG